LRGKYPLLPVKTKSSIEIVYTEQLEAQYLKVQTGSPLFKVENILYSKSGQAVEYIICKYRADKCKLLF
jgi:GntR family transcriptional regulator